MLICLDGDDLFVSQTTFDEMQKVLMWFVGPEATEKALRIAGLTDEQIRVQANRLTRIIVNHSIS